jgi:dihydroorotate dehydrogenase
MFMILPKWEPSSPPLYDIHKTYLENAEFGPFFEGKIPNRLFPPKEKWIDFLGYSVASPIGIPAGPLLTSSWVKLAAELGFDILTYKTIRSREHPAHPLPNMIYVDTHGTLKNKSDLPPAVSVDHPADQLKDLAVTNSFGMPSKSPHFLREDIPLANSYLKPGQLLVVSVVGTEREHVSFLDDFVLAALLAKEAGAKIIEANFSCPNVDKKAGCLYMSPQTVYEYGLALSRAIYPLPLIIKVGLLPNKELMREVMIAAARANVRAVSGINTISMKVIDKSGHPALGHTRLTSGICGGPIREAALEFIRDAKAINDKEKLALTLIGVGGITLPEHFDHFLESGADVAMSATGMMWDPYLAVRYHQKHHSQQKNYDD